MYVLQLTAKARPPCCARRRVMNPGILLHRAWFAFTARRRWSTVLRLAEERRRSRTAKSRDLAHAHAGPARHRSRNGVSGKREAIELGERFSSTLACRHRQVLCALPLPTQLDKPYAGLRPRRWTAYADAPERVWPLVLLGRRASILWSQTSGHARRPLTWRDPCHNATLAREMAACLRYPQHLVPHSAPTTTSAFTSPRRSARSRNLIPTTPSSVPQRARTRRRVTPALPSPAQRGFKLSSARAVHSCQRPEFQQGECREQRFFPPGCQGTRRSDESKDCSASR